MPRTSSGAPMRAVRSAALRSMMRTTSLPTLPWPRTATPIASLTALPHFQTQQVIDRFPAQDQAGAPVAHGHHGRPADQVVSARHRIAVCAGGGHTEQVTRGDVAGQPRVAHHDVAAFTVF